MSAPYEVNAFNTAASSDNKIHDDTVARQFGFRKCTLTWRTCRWLAGVAPGLKLAKWTADF
jgi:hypothetical protein